MNVINKEGSKNVRLLAMAGELEADDLMDTVYNAGKQGKTSRSRCLGTQSLNFYLFYQKNRGTKHFEKKMPQLILSIKLLNMKSKNLGIIIHITYSGKQRPRGS
jgi:hypothetical protein